MDNIKNPIKTAVVILNWNGKDFLHKFLPPLISHTQMPGVSIIVADNGSTDGSTDMLRKDFPTVSIIQLDQNYGFAGGYNKALQQVDAKYFVLLNSDVEVSPGWLIELEEYMDKHPGTAACQPKILSWYRKDHFEHAGASGGYIDYLGYPYCRGRILGMAEEDLGQYDTVKPVFWATGACLMVRSEIYQELGGLDDAFFAHMEEIDLCWRIRSRSFEIVCLPKSKVYHVGGGTLNQESPTKTYLNFRNNLLLLYKNLPASEFKKVFFIRFFLDYLAAFQLFVTGKPQNAIAILKGRRDFLKMRPDFKSKRDDNLRKATTTLIPEILQDSIIFGYYMMQRKKYSDYHGR